jgi:hypothetical protein
LHLPVILHAVAQNLTHSVIYLDFSHRQGVIEALVPFAVSKVVRQIRIPEEIVDGVCATKEITVYKQRNLLTTLTSFEPMLCHCKGRSLHGFRKAQTRDQGVLQEVKAGVHGMVVYYSSSMPAQNKKVYRV